MYEHLNLDEKTLLARKAVNDVNQSLIGLEYDEFLGFTSERYICI